MIHTCGRKVKVQAGPKSQTVNICSGANIYGQYDWIVRLGPPLVSTETFLRQNFSVIEDLPRYLQRHRPGEILRKPALQSGAILPLRL